MPWRQFPINKHYSPEALWAVCGKLLISLNAGVCMLPLESHGGLSVCPYAAQTTPPPLPSASTRYPSLLPPWLSSRHQAPAETDVWLDAIDKTTVWDGLPSQHAQLVRTSVVNHLDRGWPSRRQTLNISLVGFLKSILVHVSASFSRCWLSGWCPQPESLQKWLMEQMEENWHWNVFIENMKHDEGH